MTQQGNGDKQQALAKKQRNPIQELSRFIEGRKFEIQKILPDNLSVDRVVKTAIMAAMENPDIGQKCTPVSIYRSVVQAALMGLTVGGGFNEGYFIRYGNACTFRASYLGWTKVAIRSPGIDMIRASVVHANDELEMSEQPPAVIHIPRWNGGQRGEVLGALACAYTIREGEHELYDFTFVPLEDLDMARSANQNSGAWKKWPNEMRKKVAIRRLCKLLPRNDVLNKLTHIENNADNGIVDVPDPEALPETDNLNEMIVDARFEQQQKPAAEPEVIPPAPPTQKEPEKQTKTSKLKSRIANSKKDPPKPETPDYGPPEMDF